MAACSHVSDSRAATRMNVHTTTQSQEVMMYALRHPRGLLALLGACAAAGLAAALLWTGGTAHASPGASSSGQPSISRQRWGSVGGKAVYLYTLRSGRG